MDEVYTFYNFLDLVENIKKSIHNNGTIKIFSEKGAPPVEYHIDIPLNFKALVNEIRKNFPQKLTKSTVAYKLNFNNVVFHRDLDLSKITFLESVNFSNAKFLSSVTAYQTNFHNTLDFNNVVFNGGLNFDKSIYTDTANFNMSIFEGILNFNNSEFKSEVQFTSTTFYSTVNFESSKFNSIANFDSTTFKSDTNFSNCVFENVSNFNMSSFEDTVKFDDSKFNSEASFNSVFFNKRTDETIPKNPSSFHKVKFNNASFISSTFQQKMDFRNSFFEKGANFASSIFEGDVSFFNSTFSHIPNSCEITFNFCKFKGKSFFQSIQFNNTAYFNNTIFEKQAYFGHNTNIIYDASELSFECDFDDGDTETPYENKTIFNHVFFERAIFKDEADFKYVTFLKKPDFSFIVSEKELDFKYAIFKNGAKFFYATFKGRGAFWGLVLNGTLDFQNIKVNESSNLYFGEIKKKKDTIGIISITETVITGLINLSNANITEIDLRKSSIIGQGVLAYTKDFLNEINNWETACLFKNEEIKRNNNKSALKYKGIENEYFRKYLKEETHINGKSCKEKTLLRFERFSLWLSKKSNNHGQNWGRALLYTLVSLFIPFAIFYAPHEFSLKVFSETFGNKEFYANLVSYFSPTDYDILANYIRCSSVDFYVKIAGVLVYMLGKISTAYGIFEIIQAFRKFNTKM